MTFAALTRSPSKRAMLYELGAVPVVAHALDADQVAEAVAGAKHVADAAEATVATVERGRRGA